MEIKKIEFGSPDYNKSIELRDKILRKPLGLEFSQEFLAVERDQHHIAVFDNGRIIGILLLQDLGDRVVKMRQVAVDDKMQNKGIGSRLVEYSEEYSKKLGFKKITLHARKTAVPFYKRLGYKIVSKEFMEVGIPHYEMEKTF